VVRLPILVQVLGVSRADASQADETWAVSVKARGSARPTRIVILMIHRISPLFTIRGARRFANSVRRSAVRGLEQASNASRETGVEYESSIGSEQGGFGCPFSIAFLARHY
jgi:hypothetical protein